MTAENSFALFSTAVGGGSGGGERGIVVEKLDPFMDGDFVGRYRRRGGRGGSSVYSNWSLELRFYSRRSTSHPPGDVAEGLEMENNGDFFEFEKKGGSGFRPQTERRKWSRSIFGDFGIFLIFHY
ncbi:unnamed protein product [Linum trigynum]|uniref:Uncharacterized protein n=1 Tax=Linum trigynum TaxID=586398 RepID=A0AAV2E3H8_9ROSI